MFWVIYVLTLYHTMPVAAAQKQLSRKARFEKALTPSLETLLVDQHRDVTPL